MERKKAKEEEMVPEGNRKSFHFKTNPSISCFSLACAEKSHFTISPIISVISRLPGGFYDSELFPLYEEITVTFIFIKIFHMHLDI